METATFAAGCFWGPEITFARLEGVTKTAVGYMGGQKSDPTYQDVCTGTTNHAEVIQVEFNPDIIGYDQLLEVFWGCHDPTQLNRQGPDVGTQYRSAIFYHNDEQKQAAEISKNALTNEGPYGRPVATIIEAAPTFWRAEDYHQKYLEKRGMAFCHT